jgi:hypothetical protein
MGCHIAGIREPLRLGFRKSLAKFALGILLYPFAAIAILNDGITVTSVIGTAALLHEDTFCPGLHGVTDHRTSTPFSLSIFYSPSFIFYLSFHESFIHIKEKIGLSSDHQAGNSISCSAQVKKFPVWG